MPCAHVPHAAGAGGGSLQSGVPLPFASLSDTPQPQAPGAVFWASSGQPSTQFVTPSPSRSGSGSSTVTVNVQIAFSEAAQVIVVVPRGKEEPEGGTQETTPQSFRVVGAG